MAQAVRIDPAKLIEEAHELIDTGGAGRPRAIRLRRAVSSAYYGLFHFICLESAATLLPDANEVQRLWVARAFGHREIKDCCSWVAGREGGIRRQVKPVVDYLKTGPLVSVADAFCDLQEARHRADYDHLAPFTKSVVVAHIEDSERAMTEMTNADPKHRHAFVTMVALKCKMV